MASEGFIDLNRWGDQTLCSLLDRLDAAAIPRPDGQRRAHARYPFRISGIMLAVRSDRQNIARHRVHGRNLSAGGISVIHGSFLYVGTPVCIGLKTLMGEPRALIGRVAACRHARSRMHEVGVSFAELIDPAEFTETDACGASEPVSERGGGTEHG